VIRLGTPDDLEALKGVFRRASLSNPTDHDRLLAHPELLVLGPEGLSEGRTWVAVEEGEVVGFATWGRLDGVVELGVVELVDLFVEPEWMRRGVATALVGRVVEHLRSVGVARLEVTANPDAMAFYRAMGFVEVGQEPTELGPAPRLALTLD
jgi:GNAT superfamily N-acetyltransferase